MKYLLSSVLLFLLIASCSDSEKPPEIPEEQISLPTLTTMAVSEVTDVSALSGGNVTNDGGANVIARGVCWSTSASPTASDNKTVNATGTGEFSSSLEGLETSTTYYIRSYATNSYGTAYGNEISFSTLEPEIESKVFEGDVVLKSQQEVDEFGSEGYTEISGNLTIQDEDTTSTIQDLRPLSSLSSIGGGLFISENSILKTIVGFDELKNVGKDLVISANDSLESINAYKNLEFIGGRLGIYNVYGAIGLFENLTTIGSGLTIQFVNGISDLTFFESLKNINGHVEISFNAQLHSLEGLNKLRSISSLRLWTNNSLSSLSGLNNIESIKEDFTIQSNGALESLNGLEMLQSILNGDLEILNNHSLNNLSGLKNLKSIGSKLKINDNNALESLEGLEGLELTGAGNACPLFCSGDIIIKSNNKLLNINALENLTTAWYADIEIEFNDKLENLDGLRNLVNIYKFSQDTASFGATIESNTNLNDVCGLKNVHDNNSFRFYIEGNFNGTDNNPEGNAREMLRLCY